MSRFQAWALSSVHPIIFLLQIPPLLFGAPNYFGACLALLIAVRAVEGGLVVLTDVGSRGGLHGVLQRRAGGGAGRPSPNLKAWGPENGRPMVEAYRLG